ncbi:hypothetical protein Tco_1145794 [Tanacetum coccineum]
MRCWIRDWIEDNKSQNMICFRFEWRRRWDWKRFQAEECTMQCLLQNLKYIAASEACHGKLFGLGNLSQGLVLYNDK